MAAENVRVPAPVFVSEPEPESAPENVAARALVWIVEEFESVAGTEVVRAEPFTWRVPPARLTVPWLTTSPEPKLVPSIVTVNEPVASEPAEKKATLPSPAPVPDTHAAVAASPAALGLQLAAVLFHVPLGVAPPAPGVAPSMSQ